MYLNVPLHLSVAFAIQQYIGALASLAASADCNDTDQRICYGAPSGTSQGLDVEDVAYVAAYLRQQDGLLTMPTGKIDCSDWFLYQSGTVLVLSKHISQSLNSSVSYRDVADTIDGGESASDADKKNALIGCAEHGGQTLVKTNPNNLAYTTDEYKQNHYTPRGIIIKLVKAPGGSS